MTTSVGRNVLSGAFLGLGVAAFVDEVVFHQLLHWHHFYDRFTPAAGLVSDGLGRQPAAEEDRPARVKPVVGEQVTPSRAAHAARAGPVRA